jgi:hypothetical protein
MITLTAILLSILLELVVFVTSIYFTPKIGTRKAKKGDTLGKKITSFSPQRLSSGRMGQGSQGHPPKPASLFMKTRAVQDIG